MKFAKQMRVVAAFSVAMLIGCGLTVPLAQAEYIVTLVQQGNNVIATGSGTLDLAGLALTGSGCTQGGMNPVLGAIGIGPVYCASVRIYSGFTGPASFGIGGLTYASGGSGDTVGFDGTYHFLTVPWDYVSGNALSSNSVYDDQTFDSLGVTPGTYVWTWGTGSTGDSFNIVVVPEPSSLALLSLPLGLVLRLAARRRVL